ncbi:NACHT, LRR and PYD domains-containing protein 2 [Perognathus longimembris pacificus]|uniref:NACHT, LRR and PYD domains-containing protein 2 n=1 Tax=Perognathus longimembris pacificus TaxID=214514 RepID=UPI0020197692|nr:NACHT, LRR and PYD domains-containing protein 2 [Perognathus longimembris pacificus]
MVKKKLQELWLHNFWPGEYEKFYLVTDNYRSLIPLCDPIRRGCPRPRTVVLLGPTGVGKTTLVKKLILDWSEGKLGPAFQWAYYLSCRELNHGKGEDLYQLIFKGTLEMEGNIVSGLLDSEEVLFIVDGFDELRYKAGEMIKDIAPQRGQYKPVPVLLSSLLKRIALPNATLLVTTRPRALRELMLMVEQPILVNVEGFSEVDTQEYFHRYFRDQAQAQRALEAVKSNHILLAMSRSPAACRLLCACLQPQMERGVDPSQACQTSTALFLQFFCDQFNPGPSAQVSLAAPLEAVCHLAARTLMVHQSTFHTLDLKKVGVQDSDLWPFLDKGIVRKDHGCKWCYHFIHPSIQQFLASLFYILKRKSEEGQGHQPHGHNVKDMRKLFSKEAQMKDPDLAQTALFLFGLLNKKRAQELEGVFGCQTLVTEIRQELLECPLEETKPFLLQMELHKVFSWLYESQDKELVEEALAPFEEMSLILKSHQDLLHASFCLRHCRGLRRLTVQVVKGLFREDSAQLPCTAQDQRSGDDQVLLALWTDLCTMFCSNKNLISLDINYSGLNSSSAAVLWDILPSAYNLQKVALKNISSAGVQHNLFHKDLLPLLCKVLKHPECNLQDLRLGPCPATSQQWADFFLAIHGSPLTVLGLVDNEVLDQGSKLLCETLTDPWCIMRKLTLENCQLTQACCKDFASVLTVNHWLIHLSLAYNDLGDGGVKILCSDGCEHLSRLLQKQSRLTYLDLGLNPVGDSGMMALCQALKSPLCHLQRLWLWDCSITSTSCGELAEALRSNQKLVTLDLGQNTLESNGLLRLYTALQFQRCSLQILRLKINEANPEVRKLLREVQKVNPQLIIDSNHREPRKRRPQDIPD